MTKLELVIERIRKLPADQQEALAEEIEYRLDASGRSLLTDEQWAEVEAALADETEPTIAHEELFARIRENDRG